MAKIKFGDIVRDVKINVDRNNNPYSHYVAGDHMDSEDLTIHRFGNFETDDVGPAFTRIFKPGQILYGSRRTYLKKVAVADFEGICANTTFVMESKDESVFLTRLLPFIMLSDAFTTWSVAHSKGSTNPYVLFSDLSDYEFDLPPIEEQKKLADKLWAAYRLKESYKKLLAATDEMVKSQFIEMFGKSPLIHDMNDCFSVIRNGANIKQGQIEGGIPITRIETISEEFVDRAKMGYAGIIDNKYKPYYLQNNDILISHINSLKHIGKCALYSQEDNETIIHGMNLLCLRPKCEIVNPVFAIHMLRSNIIKNEIINITKPAVNQASFSVKDFGRIKAIIPNMDEQKKFVQIAYQADKSEFELRKSIDAIDNVIKSLIN